MTPLCRVESPSRTISLARSSTWIRPPVSTSATMRWNELDPTSSAAIRIPVQGKPLPVTPQQQLGEQGASIAGRASGLCGLLIALQARVAGLFETLALVVIEEALAQAQGGRGDLDQLVGVDEL